MLAFYVTLQSFIADRVERDDKGATMIEYGMISGLIIAVVIAAMALLGGSITTLFSGVSDAIADALPVD